MYAAYCVDFEATPLELRIVRLFNERAPLLDVALISKCMNYASFEKAGS